MKQIFSFITGLLILFILGGCADDRAVAETNASTIETAAMDLDGDGHVENITACFTNGYAAVNDESSMGYYDTCEITITHTDGGLYTVLWYYDNMTPQINFADFDINDGLIQFYLEGDGPSADPYTQVFSFDGNKIVKNVGFPGNITAYDGLGRLYSYDIYSVNAYYDLNNGLTPLPKENMVGTEIQRNFNILLSTTPGKGYTAAILSSYYEDNLEECTAHFEAEFIGMVPAETPLLVIDIIFLTDPWDENAVDLYPVPWIKVRTPEGVEGWFCVVYGD